ncbi:ABC transporter permease [Frankia sp. R82]|uniref:ABC transporter permease n=1 Tax=Frankia sp. R82 TaxID=2950553 RepID=UPI00204308FE|nr:ABC transporter permease [Frankia sp. R82]MCM3886861.1 ABC transporter permease [Frankia sp. R82]
MGCVLRAEWTKARTSPGMSSLLATMVVVTVALSAAVAATADPLPGADLPKLGLTGVQLGQAVVAVFGVLVMGEEYATGLVTVTVTAVPHRAMVLAAKAAVVIGLVAAAATVAVAGCVLVGWLLVPTGAGVPTGALSSAAAGLHAEVPVPAAPSPDAVAVRPAVGSVLYLVLIGLLSLGVATSVRSSAVGVGIVLALLYVLPIVTAVVADPTWQRHLRQLGPASVGLAVQASTADPEIGPWTGLGILVLWAVGALLAAAILLARRDV